MIILAIVFVLLKPLGQLYAVGVLDRMKSSWEDRTPGPSPSQHHSGPPTAQYSLIQLSGCGLVQPPLLFHLGIYVALCFAELSEEVGSWGSHSKSGHSEACGALKSDSGPPGT